MSSILFSPFDIGPVRLPNRLVVAPMCQYSAADGCATDWHLQHLSQLAYGGAGLVMLEATGIERRGRITHGCLGLYNDDNEAALGEVLNAVRRMAGPAKFGIQLAHAGRKASARRPWEGGQALTKAEDSWQTVAPSPHAFAEGWPEPAALGGEQIEHLVEQFAAAGARAARLGFDVIEAHCGHGYLLHQFLSPLSNHREDQYGGSLDNRMRFPLEVIAALSAALPASIALGMRISATDWVEGGWTLGDSITYVQQARAMGIHYVCVSSGGIKPNVQVPVGPGFQVPLAARIRRETGVCTRAVGLITAPQQAEGILGQEQADLVALGKGFLDDPRWGWRAADELGGKIHFPPQYATARAAGWLQVKGRASA